MKIFKKSKKTLKIRFSIEKLIISLKRDDKLEKITCFDEIGETENL